MNAPKCIGCPFRRDCPGCPWAGAIPAAATESAPVSGVASGRIEPKQDGSQPRCVNRGDDVNAPKCIGFYGGHPHCADGF